MRNTEDLLTTSEVAQILNHSVGWVNKLAATGRLPVAHKLPGHTGAYLFRREAIEAHRNGESAA